MFPWLVVGIITACILVIGADHALAANQPEGGYAVGKATGDNGCSFKGLYAEGNGFEVSQDGVKLCDIEAGVVSFSVENEHANVELLDCLTASATAELDWSGIPSVDVSASASIYSPYVEFVLPLGIFNVTITAEALIGGVGVGIEIDPDSGKFKITPPVAGVGGSFGVDFDLVG